MYSWEISDLALNNNQSLTNSDCFYSTGDISGGQHGMACMYILLLITSN